MKTLMLAMLALLGSAAVAKGFSHGVPSPHNRNSFLHKRQPPASGDDTVKTDADTIRSHRSLSFIQSGPLAGEVDQTFREASGGIHLSYVCTDLGEWQPDDKFCNFRNDSIPIVIDVDKWVDLLTGGKQPNHVGVVTDCPATTEECNLLENTLSVQSCLGLCKTSVGLGAQCSGEAPCSFGNFCQGDSIEVLNDNEVNGICTSCPKDIQECINDVGGLTMTSKKRCFQACNPTCGYLYWGEFTVDEEEGRENIMAFALSAYPHYSTPGSVYAPLVDCSNLVKDNVDTCPGAKDSVCLVHDFDIDTVYSDIAQQCESSGGLALVFYYQEPGTSDDIPVELKSLSAPVNIPVVRIAYDAGKRLKENKLGSDANVTTYDAGRYCWEEEYCSTVVPCSDKNQHCYFLEGMDEGQGCKACPEEPVNCYFPDTSQNDIQEYMAFYTTLVENTVKSCASSCDASMELETGCKTCGESFSAFELGVDDPSDRCEFCPKEDIKYPDRFVPLFDTDTTDVTCSQAQSFFSKVDVHKDSKNCKLAQLDNFVCGCEGPGYAGANTQAKRKALVWVPRVAATLSVLGSSFVLYDVVKTRARRDSLFHQLMAQMSIFDIIGSIAYAFTSAPIPSKSYYDGAKGTDATCTAQGFFIQLGTIACYTSVSLAVYYYLLIEKNWGDMRIKKIGHWFFICPILVGLAFAFAGIPYYGDAVLWCNNTNLWWPEAPVILAIFVATLFMVLICIGVYKKGKASRRWQQQGSNGTNPLNRKVFWQSFWFLMSFYMTWPPYLALQYFWAAGKSYGNYSFVLYAGMVVPLQGVWNYFVYARNRQLKHFNEQAQQTLTRTLSRARSGVSARFRKSSVPPTQTSTQVSMKNMEKIEEGGDEEDYINENDAAATPGHPIEEDGAKEAQE